LREIAKALGQAANAWADPRVKQSQLAAFYARLADDADLGREALPAVDPEILDLNRWLKRRPEFTQSTPLARALSRKLKHEGQTGHKVTFPPRF
jgi:hypothetical protein